MRASTAEPEALKRKTELSLERACSCFRVRQISEVAATGRVDGYCRASGRERVWMVQYVHCVHSELQRFCFCNPERLAQVCIESIGPRHFESHLSQVALASRFRVLEHDHAIPRGAIRIRSKLLCSC